MRVCMRAHFGIGVLRRACSRHMCTRARARAHVFVCMCLRACTCVRVCACAWAHTCACAIEGKISLTSPRKSKKSKAAKFVQYSPLILT